MTDSESGRLAREILEGGQQAQLLAAAGHLPMPPADLIPLQVRLTASTDPAVAAKAADSLRELDAGIATSLVEDGTSLEVVAYLSRHSPHESVHSAILRWRDTSPEILGELATSVGPELQELLLLRQDVIVEFPEILVELERNPQATAFTKRRINEYREHLLPREKRPQRTREELEQAADEITEDEVAEAIEEVRSAVPADGEKDESIGLTESQIRTLPIPLRLKLTRGASKALRGILIRDPNPMVATSVLHNNPLSELEVEHIANNRAVIGEVLETIGRDRKWVRKYSIVLALVKNPRTPVGMAARFVPRLSVRDMQHLARDRNVPNAVRSTAKRLYTMKRT